MLSISFFFQKKGDTVYVGSPWDDDVLRSGGACKAVQALPCLWHIYEEYIPHSNYPY